MSSNNNNNKNTRKSRMLVDEEAGFPAVAAAPKPPRHHHHGTATAAGGGGGLKRKTSKQKKDEVQAARARALSSGSTLGAFYQQNQSGDKAVFPGQKPTTGLKKRRPSQRRVSAIGATASKAGQQHQHLTNPTPIEDYNNVASYHMAPPPALAPSVSAGGSDLGDLASMAFAGLGDDIDMEELMGGPPPSSSKKKRAPPKKKYSSRSTGSGMSQLAPIADDSESNMNDFSSRSQQDEFQKRQTFGTYGTVGNSSKAASTGAGAGRNRPTSDSNNRMSMMSVDSLRVSEGSTDMNDDVQAMLSSFGSKADRANSMFMSENSAAFESNNNTFDKDRASLLGSNIFDNPQSNQGSSSTNNSRPTSVAIPKTVSEKSHTKQAPSQQEEIANFAAMLHADYGAAAAANNADATGSSNDPHPLSSGGAKPRPMEAKKDTTHPGKGPLRTIENISGRGSVPDEPLQKQQDEVAMADDEYSVDSSVIEERQSMFMEYLDPTNWLINDVKFDEDDGVPYFEESAGWTLAGMIRHFLYNPISPEFTSLQQFCWAVILGIVMGFYTAAWKEIIEKGVDFMWKDMPEALLEWGVFTDLDGSFPLYHYMWMCPAFWGGLLSYIFVIVPTPIPGQNEWIQNVHTRGVQDSETFLLLFVLSTFGMMSGLSLGPELPLVLTAGMMGSWLGIQTKQSVLQARVMNITAGSAAVGGFFGFPMAGALFVMEIPHRMGLQYFEALSPATIASIVAVLCNRLTTGNDVTGYYSYPFLTTSLPSEIFTSAIVFGLFGALIGTLYLKSVLQLKHAVHDFFHTPHDDHADDEADDEAETDGSTPEKEETPLLAKMNGTAKTKKPHSPPEKPFYEKIMNVLTKCSCFVIPHEPTRAAAAGTVAGGLCGLIGMFLPHVMFWGEAQLQTLIDKGRTPLPIFGQGDEPTAALTALGYCMIDPEDSAAVRAGFGMGCSIAITLAKIVVTGLSLGTGIIGGHFWGPLFTGCAASHFLTDFTRTVSSYIGFGSGLAAYPCVTILCTMGATHVVTFRAHTAIMLILTLTISAFDPEDDSNLTAVAGDYSAVFPLLVISVFVALMVSRQSVFYAAQRSRGDIMALPEVLCEPGKEGTPMVLDYEEDYDDEGSDYYSEGYYTDEDGDAGAALTQEDIEKEFNAQAGAIATEVATPRVAPPEVAPPPMAVANNSSASRSGRTNSSESSNRGLSPLPPRPLDRKATTSGELPKPHKNPGSGGLGDMSSSRLDELLAAPLDLQQNTTKARHRRIQSAPDVNFGKRIRNRSGTFDKDMVSDGTITGSTGHPGGGGGGSSSGGGGGRHSRSDSYGSQASGKVMRVATIGHLTVEQPSLMDQARLRAATSVIVESRHIRHPSMPSRIPRGRHSRQSSASSIGAGSTGRGSSTGPRNNAGPPLSVAVAAERNSVPDNDLERAYSAAANRNKGRTENG